ncbi:MAG: tRNA glutamyl-Q(34) synthetase GluQRS [Acidocella sp.]|nr:tRNA glutamyl-Q(34) synthetase GluQRS [Acidocella sp.]
MSVVTRFAPSPTGYLHVGHAFSAWTARSRADRFLLRLEDIDHTRCRPDFATAIMEDLTWLGLHWDGTPVIQSQKMRTYQNVIDSLNERELLYPCFCSRSDIANAQSAPHEKASVYPGTCRNLSSSARSAALGDKRGFALRLDLTEAMKQAGPKSFYEEGIGWCDMSPAVFGDVILARKDSPSSYHLCVVHDDAAMDINHVFRGDDLRGATHIHVLLQSLLGLPTPVYSHHRLLRDEAGARLSKRNGAVTLRALRQAGWTPDDILGRFKDDAKP